MLKLKAKKSKTGLMMKIHKGEEVLEHEIQEVFIGHRTIFSIVGFTIGSLFVARSLWEYSVSYVGIFGTMLIGLFVFTVSGIYLNKFNQ